MYGINVGDGGGLLWLGILGALFLFLMILWAASSDRRPSATHPHDVTDYRDRPEA
jgi:hypothetical protein